MKGRNSRQVCGNLILIVVCVQLLLSCSESGDDVDGGTRIASEAILVSSTPALTGVEESALGVGAVDVPLEHFEVDVREVERRAKTLWGTDSWQPIAGTGETSWQQTWFAVAEDGSRYGYRRAGDGGTTDIGSVAVYFDVEMADNNASASYDTRASISAAYLVAPDLEHLTDWMNAFDQEVLARLHFDGLEPQEFEVEGLVSVTAQMQLEQQGILLVLRPYGSPVVSPPLYQMLVSDELVDDGSRGSATTLAATTSSIITTSVASSATTEPATSTLPVTTSRTTAPSVTATSAPDPTTTTSTTTAERDPVTPGAFCAPTGATGKSSTGKPMICASTKKDGTPYGGGRSRWRSP